MTKCMQYGRLVIRVRCREVGSSSFSDNPTFSEKKRKSVPGCLAVLETERQTMTERLFSLVSAQTSARPPVVDPTAFKTETALPHRALSLAIHSVRRVCAIRRDTAFAPAVIRDCLVRSVDDDSGADLSRQRLTPHPIRIASPPATNVADNMGMFRPWGSAHGQVISAVSPRGTSSIRHCGKRHSEDPRDCAGIQGERNLRMDGSPVAARKPSLGWIW
jgi:hypothetical protein